MIEFKNTEAKRAGKNIQELRYRKSLSPYEFAAKINRSYSYLIRLEEGCEDKVAEETIENILKAGGVYKRGKEYTGEDLKKLLLSIAPANPPLNHQAKLFELRKE